MKYNTMFYIDNTRGESIRQNSIATSRPQHEGAVCSRQRRQCTVHAVFPRRGLTGHLDSQEHDGKCVCEPSHSTFRCSCRQMYASSYAQPDRDLDIRMLQQDSRQQNNDTYASHHTFALRNEAIHCNVRVHGFHFWRSCRSEDRAAQKSRFAVPAPQSCACQQQRSDLPLPE